MRGYLSLGSNLGDREAYLDQAMNALGACGVHIIKTSSVYETKPCDVPDRQENYYNLVVYVETELYPADLLALCQVIEKDLGRQRPYVHSPRTIDIDIVYLEGITVSTDTLSVPHPALEERSFVVYPLCEIAPDIVLPSGRPIIEVKNTLGDDDIVRMWKIDHG